MKLENFCQSCHIPKHHELFEKGTEIEGLPGGGGEEQYTSVVNNE